MGRYYPEELASYHFVPCRPGCSRAAHQRGCLAHRPPHLWPVVLNALHHTQIWSAIWNRFIAFECNIFMKHSAVCHEFDLILFTINVPWNSSFTLPITSQRWNRCVHIFSLRFYTTAWCISVCGAPEQCETAGLCLDNPNLRWHTCHPNKRPLPLFFFIKPFSIHSFSQTLRITKKNYQTKSHGSLVLAPWQV